MAASPFARLKHLIRSLNRQRLRRRRAPERLAYQQWVREHDTPDAISLARMQDEVARLHSQPTISVLMPVYNANLTWLREAIHSVQAQIYPHWNLCIADDCSTDPELVSYLRHVSASDPRIRIEFRKFNGHISECSNSALMLCTGSYTALLDQDDLLAPQALLRVAQCIDANPDVGMIYSNEDKLGPDGLRENPSRKALWTPSLLLEENHFSHLGVFKTDLMRKVGGFRKGLEGAQDHDLALRCSELLRNDQILHLPDILYHWRMHPESTSNSLEAKPYALQARLRCLLEHEQRTLKKSQATPTHGGKE